MKKIFFAILSIFAMVACIKEELPGSVEQPDGGRVTLSFDVKVPDVNSATRAMGNESIQNIDVIVFDEAGYFVERAAATLLNGNDVPNAPTTKRFSVTLNSSSNQRRIHFVANGNATQIAAIAGHEDAAISSLSVSGDTDAYWQRMVYEGGIANPNDNVTTSDAFGEDGRVIPLIRNYARVKVSVADDCDNFTLISYKVYNTRTDASVATYDEDAGEFVAFSNANLTAKSYVDLSGYTPLEKGALQTSSETAAANYTYVRETKNDKNSSDHPFVVICGTHNGKNYYYKLDFVYDNGGWANILRNFEYSFVINSVEKPGYSDWDTAAAQSSGENSLSYDMGTESFLNISDGTGQLFVSATRVILVNGNQTYVLKYKYIPNVKTAPNVTANGDVNIGGLTNNDVIETATVATSDENGWRSITIDPKEPPVDGKYEQTVRLSTETGLARDVKFILKAPYSLKVNAYDGGNTTIDKNDEEIPATLESPVWVDVTIPADIDASLFPLEFVFETEDNTLSPDASANTMPVRTGPSIILGSDPSYNTYGFVYTLTEAAYNALTATDNKKTFTAKFKTSTAVSATTVWVDNLYFAKDAASASDAFTNSKATENRTLSVSLSDEASYYGEGHEVTVTLGNLDATSSVPVDVTINSGLVQTRAQINTTYSNGTHTFKLYTNDWNTARSITVGCGEVETDAAIITYSDGSASATVNKLYIPARSLSAAGSSNKPSTNTNVAVKIGNTNLGNILFNNTGNTNSAITFERTGLSSDTELTLSYTSNGVTATATTTVGAAVSSEPNDVRFVTRKNNSITVDLNGNAMSYYGEDHEVTATITIPDASTLTLSVDQIVSNYVTLTGFEYITDNRYTSTTNTSGSLVITLNLTTSNWSGNNYTRSVNVAALPNVTNETEEITWSGGDGLATVNTLYIPEGNIKWESVGSDSYNISLFRTGSNSAIKSNIARGGSAGSNTSAITIERLANLSETEKLYLGYRTDSNNNKRYTTADTVITVKQAVDGTGGTMKWTDNKNKPNYN